jgi:hypothetical protein
MTRRRTGLKSKSVARRALFAALSGLLLAAAGRAVAADEVFQRAGGLVVYFAVVPAAFVLGHPAEHTGRGMHGSTPDGPYIHHLMVALFDSATGRRITNADVTALVRGGPPPSEARVKLEPMAIGEGQAYGGFAALPPRHRYRIEIDVVRPAATPVRAIFSHQHLQP